MANSVYRGSDTAPTTVFATAAFPSTSTVTDWVEVRGFTHVDFMFKLTSGQSVTDIEISSVEFAMDSQANSDPFPLMMEEMVAQQGQPAVAEQDKYLVRADGVFSGATGFYALPVPVTGLYMRCVFKGGPSVGSDQVTVTSIRRTT